MMRKLIIAAILSISCLTAQSQVLATANNQAGGKIILAESECPHKPWRQMMSSSESGVVWYGCWLYKNDSIYVIYFNGESRIYPSRIFEFEPRPNN